MVSSEKKTKAIILCGQIVTSLALIEACERLLKRQATPDDLLVHKAHVMALFIRGELSAERRDVELQLAEKMLGESTT